MGPQGSKAPAGASLPEEQPISSDAAQCGSLHTILMCVTVG
jgi:hypothetical protein